MSTTGAPDSIQALCKSPGPPAATPRWRAMLGQIGPQLAEEGRRCDRANEFVGANMALLREHGFLELAVPAELGGAGLSRTELSAMLRELAHYCGSTALALAMHTHVAAAAAWRWRHQKAPTDGLLKRVAAERIQLLSSGGSDWLLGSGKASQGRRRLPGLRMQGVRERRAGGQPVHDRRHRGGCPRWSGGAAIRRADERARASRSSRPGTRSACAAPARTTSCSTACSCPMRRSAARRKPGVWHPLLHIVAMVAMPLVYSVYAGIAEAARNIAVAQAAKRREPAVIDRAGRARHRARRHAHRARQHGCVRRDRAPCPETTNTIFIYRSLVAATRSGRSTWRSTPSAAPAISAGSVSSGCSATFRARAFIP